MLRATSLALLVGALALPWSESLAQEYPSKAVRMIVPLGVGGPPDLVARSLARRLSQSLKQSFVVENRTGASGIIGTEAVAKSEPDGYTLLVVAPPHIALESLDAKKSYHLMRDFVAVAPIFSFETVMVVHPSVPAKNLAEFIALAKSKPGVLTYASAGPGSAKHMAAELFRWLTGTDIFHVSYKSSTGARNDVLGGHVHMMFDETPNSAPNVESGQLRALGTGGLKRSTMLPDVPTLAEAGVPGFEHSGCAGIMAPAGTPKPIIELLNAEIKEFLADPEVRAVWAKQGGEPMSTTPAEFDAYLHAEIERWRKVVKMSGIKIN